jgi:hypothetical protein
LAPEAPIPSRCGDLAPLWNDVRSITLTGTRDELKQAGGDELLHPILDLTA